MSCNIAVSISQLISPNFIHISTPVKFIAANQVFNPTLLQLAEGTTKAGIKREDVQAFPFVSDGSDEFRLGVNGGKLAVFDKNGNLVGNVAFT